MLRCKILDLRQEAEWPFHAAKYAYSEGVQASDGEISREVTVVFCGTANVVGIQQSPFATECNLCGGFGIYDFGAAAAHLRFRTQWRVKRR